jgi:hypothetical protein
LGSIAQTFKTVIPFPGIFGEIHVKNLVRKGYKPLYTTNKIAVVIVIEWALDHLEKILERFDSDEYDLIYITLGKIPCDNYSKLHNCGVFSIWEVIKRKQCYKLALTSHVGDNTSSAGFNYGIELIAQKMLFVASLADFDYGQAVPIERYNYVVCIGEQQKKQLQKLIDKDKLFVIGSPRFDNYKDDKDAAEQIIALRTGKELCPNKKNILWLTTHGKIASSIKMTLQCFQKYKTISISSKNRTRSVITRFLILKTVSGQLFLKLS